MRELMVGSCEWLRRPVWGCGRTHRHPLAVRHQWGRRPCRAC